MSSRHYAPAKRGWKRYFACITADPRTVALIKSSIEPSKTLRTSAAVVSTSALEGTIAKPNLS
jgi:hypothetical protein